MGMIPQDEALVALVDALGEVAARRGIASLQLRGIQITMVPAAPSVDTTKDDIRDELIRQARHRAPDLGDSTDPLNDPATYLGGGGVPTFHTFEAEADDA